MGVLAVNLRSLEKNILFRLNRKQGIMSFSHSWGRREFASPTKHSPQNFDVAFAGRAFFASGCSKGFLGERDERA